MASSVSFGRRQLAPRVPGFLDRYPGVTLDLLLSDRNEDLIGEGVDVALRIGTQRDSGLLGRRLGDVQRWTVAAPGYLARHVAPRRVEDLRGHNCLIFTQLADGQIWSYRQGRTRRSVTVTGSVRCNSSEAIRELVIAGQGIANPIGTILSVAFLLRYSLGLTKEADTVERSVDRVLGNGCRTGDIVQKGERGMSTREMGDAILAGIG